MGGNCTGLTCIEKYTNALLRVEVPRDAPPNQRGPKQTSREGGSCSQRSLLFVELRGTSGSVGPGALAGKELRGAQSQIYDGERGHHSTGGHRRLGSIDMCQLSEVGRHEVPWTPTLSTNPRTSGFPEETREDAEFSTWVGREEEKQQPMHKVLRDK